MPVQRTQQVDDLREILGPTHVLGAGPGLAGAAAGWRRITHEPIVITQNPKYKLAFC